MIIFSRTPATPSGPPASRAGFADGTGALDRWCSAGLVIVELPTVDQCLGEC